MTPRTVCLIAASLLCLTSCGNGSGGVEAMTVEADECNSRGLKSGTAEHTQCMMELEAQKDQAPIMKAKAKTDTN